MGSAGMRIDVGIAFAKKLIDRLINFVLHDKMRWRFWLFRLLALGLCSSFGCVGSESNKPTASNVTSSGADVAPSPLRIAYGPNALQFGELRVPKGPGPFPIVVVLHGGCWVNFYGLDLMHDMSEALTAEGLATWNVEYRRLGDPESEYPNTLVDVGLAVDHLRTLAPEHALDLTKVTTVGHSAGGHLAVWVAARHKLDSKSALRGADPLPIRTAIALAGVLDLEESLSLGVCNGTAAKLMQGTPADVPTHYAEASPRSLLPLGVSQILVHGMSDSLVPFVMSDHYLTAAKGAGEGKIVLVPIAGGDHFDVITPSSSKWPMAMKSIVDAAR